jgi:nucleotide-binding universal stress UspA family protein
LICVKQKLDRRPHTDFVLKLPGSVRVKAAMFRKILVPTDGSALSESAASAAVALARGSGAEIVALSVAQQCDPPCAMVDDGTWAAQRERALNAAAQRAGRVARLAHEAGVPHSLVTAMASSQHDELIRVALELHCDLIFLAAHGQCGVTRLIAGRVPQLVLAYSPVPVILYRGGTVPA